MLGGLPTLLAVAAASDVPFAAQPPLTVFADTAWDVVGADVDQDGDIDVVTASREDHTIAWFENLAGDGSAWSEHLISDSRSNAVTVFVADIDADGDPDVLASSDGDSTIAWHQNLGGGGSWSEHFIDSGNIPRMVVAADLDADGDLDAVSAKFLADDISWHENLGGGTSWSTHVIDGSFDGAYDVFVADAEGDGDLDVVAAALSADQVVWYENDGDSTWPKHLAITTTADGAISVSAGDVDGDGDMDLVSGSLNSDEIAWYENVFDGAAFLSQPIATTTDGPRAVSTVDVDADGDLDVLFASGNDDELGWHENLGAGATWTTHVVATDGDAPYGAAAADVDGDGDLDLLSASTNDDTITWYRNDTIHRSATFATEATISTGALLPEGVVTGDIDGDGDLDAVSASVTDNEVAWYENDGGAASSWLPHVITNAAGNAFAVAVADLDQDGDLDVVAAALSSDSVFWYENDGAADPSWTSRTLASGADGARAVAIADLDADGDLDVASGWRDAATVAWHENDGAADPTFTTHSIDTACPFPLSVAVGDLDADGDLDLAAACRDDDTIAWYANDSALDPGFVKHTITTSALGASAVAIADVDRDGALDVVAGSRDDNTVAWYENDGAGGSWTARVVTTSAVVVFAVAAADLDADGDLDLAAASNGDATVAWFESDGAAPPTFAEHTVDGTAAGATWVHVADLDGDGDLDLLGAAGSENRISWYENVGGQFALATDDTAPAPFPVGSEDDVLAITVAHRGRSLGGGLDHALELATLELAFDDGTGAVGSTPLDTASLGALVESVDVYLDQGDGDLGAGDTLVESVPPALTDGALTVTFDDGDPLVEVDAVEERTYLVVLAATADADEQAPNQLRIRHLTEASSTAEDRDHDLPLRLEAVDDTSSVVIPFRSFADLAITKSDGVTAATPGGSVTYTIVANNAGPHDAPASVVSDTFPGTLTCNWTCGGTGGGTCAAAGAGNIADTVSLPAGGSVTYVATCTIAAGATGSLVNTATVATTGTVSDPVTADNSATDTDTLTPSANLGITKTDGVTTATPGGTVTYTIVASNAGPSHAPGSTVTDTFPGTLDCDWTCGGAGGGTCTASGSGNVADTVSLPAGGSVTYSAVCTIAAGATGSLVNTATVAAGAGVSDPASGNNSATDTDTLSPSANLGITKTDGVATATPGGTVTYTIVAGNAGPSDAPGSTVTDTFPGTLDCDWTCGGADGGTCTASGSGNVVDTVSLPAGGSVTYSAVCTIAAGATGSLVNTATVATAAGVTDPASGNNGATDTDTLAPSADLAITKTDGVTTATAGGTVVYTITASNAGPSDAPGSTVTDTFPATLDCDWTCGGTGGGTCTAAGSGSLADPVTLPAGGSVTYTATCSIAMEATGTLSNTATVAPGAGVSDPTSGNDSATDIDTLTVNANLGITKTDGVATATPGGTVVYTITASNAGPSNAPGSTVTDTFPGALDCDWTCVGDGGASCTAAGSGNIADTVSLPLGDSVTYTATCSVAAGATGSLANTATVATGAGVSDPTSGNDSATDTDTLTPSADLSITKTDGVTSTTPGGVVTYTIVASNAGPSDAPGSTVTDTFPATLDCDWTCGGANGGSCTASGSGNLADTVSLPVGASVTYTATCDVSPDASNQISNTATVAVSAGVSDPVPGNGSATDVDLLPNIFASGFEAGDTSEWSAAAP